MLKAHPLVMRELVEQYEAFVALTHTQAVEPGIQRQMQDAAFTLCVSTGSHDVDAALAAAREQLDGDFPGIAVARRRAAARRTAHRRTAAA